MKILLILIISVFATAETSVSVPTEPAFIECAKLGQKQCGGICKSVYGGEGKCTWGPRSTGGYCYCAPIAEPSLSCSCPGSARKNPMCDSGCRPEKCAGGCYKGQKGGSKCHCSSSCSELRGDLYWFHSCGCSEGTCIEKTSTEPVGEGAGTY